MSYVTIGVQCPKCGKRIEREVEEDVMPSSIGCRCGARVAVQAEPVPLRRFRSFGGADDTDLRAHDIAHHRAGTI